MKYNYPVDPDCPEVKEFVTTLRDDPMTKGMGAPVDEIEEDFFNKHRMECKHCQAFGAANLEVVS